MHFREFLEQKLGSEMDFQIRHWTFEELEHLRPGIVARKLAEETHVLVLVTEELRELAVGVRKWMISWLDQARPWYALICLSGTRDLCECLRNACREAGVNFFASRFRTDTAAIHRQVRRAPAAHDAEEGGVTHWGINE
jgi:hypothetical protein